MIDQRTPTLADALRALSTRDADHASTRNGVGFNGSDTTWGNRLAALAAGGRLRWRPGEYAETHARLAKYAAQLAGYGVDFSAIPATEPAAAPVRAQAGQQTASLPEQAAEPMIARVNGVCALCGGVIVPGTSFLWGFNRGERIHAPSCPEAPAPTPSERPRETPANILARPATAQPASNSASTRLLGADGPIAASLAGYAPRPSQITLAGAVDAALDGADHLVAEAPTGVGKSLAYLIPAIVAAQARGERTIISTSGLALQDQIWHKDVPHLQEHLGLPFRAARVKGRSNYVCLQAVADTRERVSGLLTIDLAWKLPSSSAAWPALDEWAETTTSGELAEAPVALTGELREAVTVDADACLGQKCPLVDRCHAERVKAEAKDADVVIVNHALLLRDLSIRELTDGYAGILPEATAYVIDEAHSLEEWAASAFGVELTAQTPLRLQRALERLTTAHPEVSKARADAGAGDVSERAQWHDEAIDWMQRLSVATAPALALFAVLEQRLTEAGDDALRLGDESALGIPVADGYSDLVDGMLDRAPSWLKAAQAEQWKKLRTRLATFAMSIGLLTIPGDFPEKIVRHVCWEAGRDGTRVLTAKATPIDVAPILRRHLFSRTHPDPKAPATVEGESDLRPHIPTPVVAVSATLASDDGLRFWRARVGCDDGADLIVDSPFDYRRQARIYLPADADRFDPSRAQRAETRESYYAAVAAEMLALVRASAGGAFLLFTSRRGLEEAERRIRPALDADGRLTLSQADGRSRPQLVEAFKADGHAVLFGLKSFWEGVDVQGAALRLVVIDKMPFNQPGDPVWAARCDALDRAAGRDFAWFDALGLPTAVIAVKQGSGRLIRTTTDRGVIALLDGRLSIKRYGQRVLAALPPAPVIRSLDAVAAFYRS